MSAIYRFGFENGRVPDGVVASNATFVTGRYNGTALRTGTTGTKLVKDSTTGEWVSVPTSKPAATTALSVTLPVTGDKAFASYFCWLTSDTAMAFDSTADYTLASFAGNSVGFSADSLWIKTAGGAEQRISKEDLAGTYMELGAKYYVTVEFQLGVTGHISLYWDGLTVSYSGDTGSVPQSSQLVLYCPSFNNRYTTSKDKDGKTVVTYGNGYGYLDDIAVNDGNGNIDTTVPGPIACFAATSVNALTNAGWSPSALADVDAKLNSRAGITAASSGSRVVLGYTCTPPITPIGFEGINVLCRGMSKTGSGKIGMRYGQYEAGSYYQKSSDINLSYASASGSYSVFYAKNAADTDPNNLSKYSLADGAAIGTYFEVV